jgi:hypothetical protein
VDTATRLLMMRNVVHSSAKELSVDDDDEVAFSQAEL